MVVTRSAEILQALPSAVRRKARAKLASCLTAKFRAQIAVSAARFDAAAREQQNSEAAIAAADDKVYAAANAVEAARAAVAAANRKKRQAS